MMSLEKAFEAFERRSKDKNYYIATKDSSFGYDTTSYWNRRKQRWQAWLCVQCVYPTVTGAKRIFHELSIDNPNIDFYMKRI